MALDLRAKARRRRRDRTFEALLVAGTVVALAVLASLLVSLAARGLRHLDVGFLTSYPSRFADRAGARSAILGTFWLMVLVAAMAVPLGIASAIHLEEFARGGRVHRAIETNIANLAGVPSIIYGLLGLAVFVRAAQLGRVLLAGALTVTLLVLPTVIIAAREALRAVPSGLREAAMALGATRWEAVRHQVLPSALPGMLTGVILGLSRAVGETAPLITIGAITFIAFDPSPLRSFTVLPIQIFNWTTRPQEAFSEIAAAGSLVLLALLLGLNAVAVLLRNRARRRTG